ncbi:MAG TPA: hypothetical protein VNS55_05695 [Nocardioides sp.]|nr:hypothetical protein [Nocardioides sp.]
MDMTTSPETQPGRPVDSTNEPDVVDRTLESRVERRIALRDRHAQGLTRLMGERADLRGVHALADFVDDAVRWTA